MKFGAALLLASLFGYGSVYADQWVFFGDSLTDTGNYPEPADIKAPTAKNFNLYVPVSNPVPNYQYGRLGYPGREFLKNSIREQGLVNGQEKALYSINWPLYFVSSLGGKGLTPWVQYQLDPSLPVNYINYAWASAIASGSAGCFHDDGRVYSGECSVDSILTQRRVYRDRTREDLEYDRQGEYQYQDIQIPNLAKQVALYLEDPAVSNEDDVKFFIFIGGNDISSFLKSYKSLFKIAVSVIVESGLEEYINKEMTVISDHVFQSVSALLKRKNTGFVYVLTLPDLSDLALAHTYTNRPLIGERFKFAIQTAVTAYNDRLLAKLGRLERVRVINSGAYIDVLAKTLTYKQSVADASVCIADVAGDYTNPSVIWNPNCEYTNNPSLGYFSWNNAHYVTGIYKLLSEYVIVQTAHYMTVETGCRSYQY